MWWSFKSAVRFGLAGGKLWNSGVAGRSSQGAARMAQLATRSSSSQVAARRLSSSSQVAARRSSSQAAARRTQLAGRRTQLAARMSEPEFHTWSGLAKLKKKKYFWPASCTLRPAPCVLRPATCEMMNCEMRHASWDLRPAYRGSRDLVIQTKPSSSQDAARRAQDAARSSHVRTGIPYKFAYWRFIHHCLDVICAPEAELPTPIAALFVRNPL